MTGDREKYLAGGIGRIRFQASQSEGTVCHNCSLWCSVRCDAARITTAAGAASPPMWVMRQYRAEDGGLASTAEASKTEQTLRRRLLSGLVLLLLYLAITILVRVRHRSTRRAGVCSGSLWQPSEHSYCSRFPAAQAVLIAVILASIFGGLTIHEALAGMATPRSGW